MKKLLKDNDADNNNPAPTHPDRRTLLTDVTHPPAIAEVQHKRFWMR